MGGCGSKPKVTETLETPATTENVVVESKNVEPEAVAQEKADEVVVEEKKEESAGDGAETQKDAEPAKPAEVEAAPEAPKTEAAVETVDETEPPKVEEAAASANDTKTNEEPLVAL